MTYTDAFNKAVQEVLVVEGVFSDHAKDPGGKTMYGISTPLAKEYGIADVKTITKGQAINIYYHHFWNPNNCDELSERFGYDLALEIFESAVNIGQRVPARWLQNWLNLVEASGKKRLFAPLKADGVIGPKTISAIEAIIKFRKGSYAAMYNWLNSRQYFHYYDLCYDKPQVYGDFFWGWVSKRCTFMPDAKG
jgi:lysozyme family protein